MSVLALLPLVVVAATLVAWLGSKRGGRIDRVVSRLARAGFGRFVSEDADRKRAIQAAYVDSSYRTYAAKTYLFAVLGLVGGGLAVAYLVAGLLLVLEPVVRTLAQLPNTIAGAFGFTDDFELVLSAELYWGLLAGSFLVGGLVLAVLAYLFRWQLPESTAAVRRRSIEEGLPRTAAFMYALSRGGMGMPAIMETLADNAEVYGESAREVRIAVREMELFGRDVITAIRRMAKRTPSDQFKTFAENLASVLQSGSDRSAFLEDQYERFREEAEQRQAEILDLLATIAEGYVTVLVAGVLFFITILLVFGLTTTDTLPFLRMIGYLIVPLANAGFAIFLAQQLELLGVSRGSGGGVLDRLTPRTPTRSTPRADRRRADGGLARDADAARTLALYDRVSRLKRLLRRPFRTVLWNPATVLYATVPLALLLFFLRLPAALTGAGVTVRILDDLVVQSALLALAPYAVVRWLYVRRVNRIEAATPELLERLASLNEAGMTVVEGVERVRGGDLGVLTPEVDRIYRDIEYGSNVEDALIRFGRRVRTTAITRVVVLLTNAMRASSSLGRVLRIAGEQARADLRLRRQRRQQMLTYLVVIYVSFAVFLVIIVAVNQVLVPSLPEAVPTPSADQTNRLGVSADQFTRFGQVDKAAYTLIFFHTALIQAVCSGFIAGQLGNGSLRDGAKHAAAMLAIAYVVFLVLSAPVASVALGPGGATVQGEELTVDSVSTSGGGFLVARTGGINGTVLGTSDYLEPGTQADVRVPLDRSVGDGTELLLTVHRDTDGDGVYEFAGPYRPGGDQIDAPYPPVSDGGSPGVRTAVNATGG